MAAQDAKPASHGLLRRARQQLPQRVAARIPCGGPYVGVGFDAPQDRGASQVDKGRHREDGPAHARDEQIVGVLKENYRKWQQFREDKRLP
jgi:hypothetical protein